MPIKKFLFFLLFYSSNLLSSMNYRKVDSYSLSLDSWGRGSYSSTPRYSRSGDRWYPLDKYYTLPVYQLSKQLLLKSNVLENPKEAGEVYDVQIVKNKDKKPTAIILRTTKKIKYTIPWEYTDEKKKPKIDKEITSDTPQANPRIYTCLYALDTRTNLRFLVTNRNEKNEPLPAIIVELFKDSYRILEPTVHLQSSP